MGNDNQWIMWIVIAIGAYWLITQSQTTAAAPVGTTIVPLPPGAYVVRGSLVYGPSGPNAQVQQIGTITSTGSYVPNPGN